MRGRCQEDKQFILREISNGLDVLLQRVIFERTREGAQVLLRQVQTVSGFALPDDFYALLDDADVVLLPYQADVYKAGTSAIFGRSCP